ncbi:MAG: N-acetylmuramoyl-L-alanine amidase [Clostridia bacterium]|nr:N-acetylmuramoyl-L-alanine amidase [Clostridia bacterium]
MAIKIFIDQGHNPRNPNAGAEGQGLREQDLTYEIGRRLALLLAADPNYEVMLSRPSPETQLGTTNAESLRARVDMANNWGADYFISLHANASSITSASGSEGYVYSLGGAAEQFAGNILTGLSDITGLPDRGVFARPSLYVLRRTRMPATLIELGFITNPGDAALMSENPQLFAQGLYLGINRYFGLA